MEKRNISEEVMVEEFWRSWMVDGPPASSARKQKIFKLFPAKARCKFCFAPFDGFTHGFVKSILNVHQSNFNTHVCNTCDDFSKKYRGGAEVPVTMLFADIRGSTALAEKIGAKDYSKLINRFFIKSTLTLSNSGAMIEKIVGDEVVAIFSQGLAGENYSMQAIKAAKDLLIETGHRDKEGPWVRLGIGIHTGYTFVGSIGRPNGIMEVAALGDVPNTAARLTSLAAPGEILVSEDTIINSKLDTQGLDKRHFELKGREKPIFAYALNV
jgi:adenylate cyclase